MTVPVAVRSMFNQAMTVMVDPWAVNPLLDDALQAVPEAVNLATVSDGDAPTMFDSGDLPPFTASGVDPRFLAILPWRIRHAAAMNPESGQVLEWVEQYGHDDTIEMTSQGLNEYVARFRNWLAGKWTNPSFRGADPQQQAAAEGDLFDAMFGAAETARQAKVDAVNASYSAFRDKTDWRTRTAAGQAAGRAVRPPVV